MCEVGERSSNRDLGYRGVRLALLAGFCSPIAWARCDVMELLEAVRLKCNHVLLEWKKYISLRQMKVINLNFD